MLFDPFCKDDTDEECVGEVEVGAVLTEVGPALAGGVVPLLFCLASMIAFCCCLSFRVERT